MCDVATAPETETDERPCDGSMVCECPACAREREQRVARGIRRTRGNPLDALQRR